MNKIFRIVWSHATQSWVAVSELTKAHKKQSRNSLKAAIGAAAVLLSINSAEAASVTIDNTNGTTIGGGSASSGFDGVAIGDNAQAGIKWGISIGKNSNSVGERNIAIGMNARVGDDGTGNTQSVNQSIAIGGDEGPSKGARAYGDQSIAIGSNTIARGNSSIAIGNDDVDKAVEIATTYTNSEGKETTGTVGQAYNNLTGRNLQYDGGQYKDTKAGQAAVAIGVKAQAGDISVALGAGASAEKTNAVAFGTGATASLDNSVALGGGSLTDIEGTKETSTTVNGHTYNWSGGDQTNKGDIVSFGKKGFERQLKNVAAGKVSDESTDAINGSQLHGILNSITIDPAFSYAGDNAAKDEVKGADVNEKKADAATKKIVVRSFKDGRLNLLGGATGELSDNNIGVNYDSENTIKFKLAKALTGLTSTDVGGIVTNAGGINMDNKPITNLAEGTNSTDAVNKSQLDKVATNNIKLGGDSGTTDAQQLDQTGGLQFNVKGTNGLTTTASGKDVTVKLDDATKAAVDSIANKIENNKIKLSATNDSSSTSEQDLNKAGGIEFKVKGDNGLTASASGDTVTLKLDDATKAKVDSVDSKIGDNNISLGSDSGSTDTQALTNTGGMKFNIKGENGLTTTASGKDVTVKLDDTTKAKIDNAADKDLSNITDAGKKQIKDQVTWKAKATNSKADLDQDTKDSNDTAETIGADGILTLDAGKNLRLQRKGKVFTYGLESNLTGINSITGLANTLPVTKNDAAAPTTNQPAPTNVDGTKAASVNDILNAGWNLKENDTDKDFVKAYDTVKFVDGTGTTANVTVTENGAVSAVKFDVKKATLTADADKGTVSADNAGDSFATANDVANAINKAFWKVTGAEDGGEFAEGNATTEEAVKAGDKVTFKAGKNIKLKQAGKDFTYSLNPVLSDITSIGGNRTTMTFKPEGVDLGGKKITNIAPGTDGKDAVNKSQLDTAVQEVAAKPLSFSGDNKEAGKFDRTLGTEVKVVGGETDESKLSDNNIGVIGNTTDTLTVKLAKSLKGLSSVEVKDDAGNTTNITQNGITISQPEKDGKKPDNVSLTKDGLNNGGQNITNVAGNLPGAKKDTAAPTTASEGPSATDLPNITNNAATVGDVLNAGWNLKNNGEARDFVKPYDTVNFINGKGTVAVVETAGDATSSTVKFDVDAGEITADTTKPGAVKGPNTTGKTPAELAKNLSDAQKAVDDLAKDPSATEDAKQKAQDALKAAQAAAAPLNKVATAQNVADMINASGFTLTTSNVEGGEKDATSTGDEVIKPGKAVEMIAGKNLTVKQEANGKVTYATKDNVEFTSVKVGEDKEGKKPVNFTTEAASPASNNGTDKTPTTALNISSSDGKPTQLKGVGSVLNTKEQPTSTGKQGDTPATAGNQNLVNLGNNPITGKSDLAPEILNSAATVGDLANMGWMVSAKDNNYTNTVKNANKVEFKGSNGVEVTGKTLEDGTREITVALKEGKVTNNVTITKADGSQTHAVRGEDGKIYEKDPVTGKATDKEIPVDAGDTVTNDGNSYVTGNTVATAIQKSGWNIGIGSTTKEFSKEEKVHEKVNPNDNVKYVNGDNTTVSMAVDSAEDKDGTKVTTTYVKFDVNAADLTHNTNGTVNGPVTAEMKKALDEAKKALADLPANATPEAKKAAEDKVNVAQANINKVGNPVATAQSVADAINNSGFTLTTSENGGKKLSGDDEIINPGKKVDLAAGKNMTVRQDAEGKVTYATADEVNFSSVQFGDNGPKINAAGNNINIGDKDGKPTKITGVKAGDISPTSTDAVNGAQIYALSRGNVPNVENITVTNPDGSKTTYKDIVVDENGTPILKTYNVQGQKEIITNSVVEAIHNMNEQGIKFFHSNDGVNRPKMETENNFDSSASGKFATAIGSRSKADGTNAVAIGFNSVVTGNDSISIGTGNRVTGNNSGAFGDPSIINGNSSYSVGNNNTVATNDTFVLGNEVKHTVENSVILGTKSTATAGDGSRTASLYNIKQDGTKGTSTTAGSVGTVTTATVGNMTYGGFQGAKADGVVSVGAAGNERRIQNVAAGEISSTSTDAINGSQLYSVANGVGNRINNLQGQVNKLGKRMNAGVAGAMAAANLMQPHKPGQSAAMAAIGQHHGEAAVAVGYSRISDNGKYGVKLSVGANTQGQLSTGAGVSYFW